ncbi:MAG: hypothetical protein HY023_15865 [Chloroflexi bacterium]|nr:hypothetical protein [Chloroflexota bacterium]
MSDKRRLLFPLFALAIVIGGLSASCGGKTAPEAGQEMPMADLSMMPSDVQSAPVSVQQAYQFAVANPDILQQIPCYCGCGAMGHTSNYSCYVAGVDAGGKVTFDLHATGCSICVDITQDTMRLLRQGKSIQEIRGYVDSAYSKYGPSNMAN